MGKLGLLKRGIKPDTPHQELKMTQQGCSCGNSTFNVFSDGKDILIVACSNCGNGLKYTSHGNVDISPVKDVKPLGSN